MNFCTSLSLDADNFLVLPSTSTAPMDTFVAEGSSFAASPYIESDGSTLPVNDAFAVSEVLPDVEQSTEKPVVRPNFLIDSSAIRSIPAEEQAEELRLLGLNVYDQTVLEEGIMEQVDKAFQQQEAVRQQQVAQKTLKTVLDDIKSVKVRLKQIDKALAMMPKITPAINKDVKRQIEAIRKEKENKQKQLKSLRAKQRSLVSHIDGASVDADTDVESQGEELDPETKFQLEQVLELQHQNETEQEKMIRMGHMTPFGTMLASGSTSKESSNTIKVTGELTDFEKFLLDQGQAQQTKKQPVVNKSKGPKLLKLLESGTKNKTKGGGSRRDEDFTSLPSTSKHIPPLKPPKKQKRRKKEDVGTLIKGQDDKRIRRKKMWWPDPDANAIDLDELAKEEKSGSEYEPSHSETDENDEEEEAKIRRKIAKNAGSGIKKSGSASENDEEERKPTKMTRKKLTDDGNQADYVKRLKKWRSEKLLKKHEKLLRESEGASDDEEEERDEDNSFEEFEGGYRIPLSIWNKLYRYQQTCVRWLWELHSQRCGGIMGDEMGLGKTIQAIAYLVGLSKSNVCSKDGKFSGLGPVIIVTPTTVMHQWLKEFHTWWPPFRVAILHDSGSYTGTKESLVRNINSFPGILITSYSGIVIHQHILLKYDWHYILLDEGHKIRNPNARVTLVVKQFRTPHRFILSGSPLQNHLKELWSLFDFIFPGKLGTLPVFMQQFAVPITHGGYSNASQVQVQTAYRCAVVLRDTISPYLLRRMKSDVKMNLSLPSKNEQVLFCRLTQEQRDLYKEYLDSKEIKSILDGRLQVFVGLINLRKICNHADLYSGGPKVFGKVDQSQLSEEMHYGYFKRSGKMVVIEAILKLWHQQGHRVLLFSQSKQMLDILERFVQIKEYTYLRMDGGTNIASRQPLVNRFNTDPGVFVFLLTTRVGGLGVNLTGANRVVIFDPDWNPSTDMQARERAWRIGQQRDVTIYRLLTSGTIEEKIYHRQIFKQFLTNRVLKDPRQRRFFKSNELFELFVLREEGNEGTETSAIFAGTGSEVKVDMKRRQKSVEKSAKSDQNLEKIQKMRELAKKLSQKIAGKASGLAGSNCDDAEKTSLAGNTPVVDITKSQELPASTKTANGACKTDDEKPKKRSKMHRSSKKKRRGTSKRFLYFKKSCGAHFIEKLSAKNGDVEGIQLDYLAGKDTYKSSGQEQEATAKNAKQDEYVLQKLFAKTGVHTALKHDTIIESSDPDYMLVEGEAERVAKEAVKALKASRRHCYRAEAGVPTWTGSHGLSGAPIEFKKRNRFGKRKDLKLPDSDKKVATEESLGRTKNPFATKKVFTGDVEAASGTQAMTSSQLLDKMRQRNHLNPATGRDSEEEGETNSVPTTVDEDRRLTTEYDELLCDVRNCIAFQCTKDGEATTEEILTRFKDKLPARDSAVFKALLNKICNFNRNSKGEGIWQLKEEFRI